MVKPEKLKGLVSQACGEETYSKASVWPPDAFAIAAWVLQCTGSYALAVHTSLKPKPKRFHERLRSIGEAWRNSASKNRLPPEFVRQEWQIFEQHLNCLVSEAAASAKLTNALLNIIAVADEACKGLAYPQPNGANDPFYEIAAELLATHPDTLCNLISPDRLRVLPKVRTPQVGLTLRNLTHYLALCPGGEVSIGWFSSGSCAKQGGIESRLNLLLVPYPYKIASTSFQPVPTRFFGRAQASGQFSYFSYKANDSTQWLRSNFPAIVKRAADTLSATNEELHGVVFPESSFEDNHAMQLAIGIMSELCPDAFLVAGVNAPAEEKTLPCQNKLCFAFPMYERIPKGTTAGSDEIRAVALAEQSKHHRWKLDDGQIERYDMQLGAGIQWWEHIDVRNRTLHFFSARNDLTFCILICEDLARQEPVTPIVRAVAPHLVIALLQDGPQLANRWSARYAGILADDPGSSVLSLTSVGMARLGDGRSNPAIVSMRSRAKSLDNTVVALWRDSRKGTIPLSLSTKHQGILLRLNSTRTIEYSADGRSNDEASLLLYHAHESF